MIVRDNLDIEVEVSKAIILNYGSLLENIDDCKLLQLDHSTG